MAHLVPTLSRGSLARVAMSCAGTHAWALSACFWTFVFAVLGASSTPTYADAWLDRVERNLKRIEAASKLAEPVRIGSRAAKKAHGKCTRDGDLRACEKIIWRQKELLPIEDWAVGTAHIKRGEMREKVGDVDGALEDYRDALGYHKFYSLTARIKRLTLRQQRQQKKSNTKDSEQAVDSQGETKSQSTAIVDGWTPKFRTNVAPEREVQAATKSEALTPPPPTVDGSNSQVTGEPSTDETESQEILDEAPSDVVKQDHVTPSSDPQIDVVAKPDSVDPEVSNLPAKETVSAVTSETQPQETSQNQLPEAQPLATRVVEDVADQVGGGVARLESGVAAKEPVVVEETETIGSRPAPTHAISEEKTPGISDETQSAGQTKTTQTRDVLSSGNPDITTAALPTRAVDAMGHAMSDVQRPLMIALIALVLGSSLVLVLFNRGNGWGRRSTQTQGEPSLSVEDLELLITQRTAETSLPPSQKQTLPFPRPPSLAPSTVEASSADSSTDNDAGDNAKADCAAQDAQAAAETPASSGPVAGEEVERPEPTSDASTEASRQGAEEPDDEESLRDNAETPNPFVQNVPDEDVQSEGRCFKAFVSTAMPPKLEPLVGAPAPNHDSDHANLDAKVLRTLLRRVSFGAASVIVVGREEVLQSTIAEHVAAPRRSEFMNGLLRWERSEPRAAGCLNPFDLGPAAGHRVIEDQNFETAFDCYIPLFDTLFGADFVQVQRDMLQHLTRLLYALPNPSLSALRSCLEDGRTEEAVEPALSKIDHEPTRQFLTTTFVSEDFSEPAEFMRKHLADVLSNAHLMHLCGERTDATCLTGSDDVGRVMFLPFEGGDVAPALSAVLLQSLFAVLRLTRFTREPVASDNHIAVSLYIPEFATYLGGEPSDIDFFVDQLNQSGYEVL